ncbi:hypothetical protein ElyMa_001753400 [Elysia marginata]|uniref:Reverse transcriptase domain-containing protein n=1 Tax=Elysia marginata TaxID=1093978 RepID=A0AAV4E9S9_9GAST|nr:hypothetical protein ElyMa_001753400 [Elysia marginata]
MPSEIVYADDIDIIGTECISVGDVEKKLKTYKLKVNLDKIEHTCVSKDTEKWKISNKVGSLLGSKEDIERRKQLSNQQIFGTEQTKQKTRLQL